VTFTPTPAAQWKKNQSWYEALKTSERKANDKLKLAMGKVMSDNDIIARLGVSSTPLTGGVGNSNAIDLSDVLDD